MLTLSAVLSEYKVTQISCIKDIFAQFSDIFVSKSSLQAAIRNNIVTKRKIRWLHAHQGRGYDILIFHCCCNSLIIHTPGTESTTATY